MHQIEAFLTRLKALPIEVQAQPVEEVLALPLLAQTHNLTTYDAAYLALAISRKCPLATTDAVLCKAADAAGLKIVTT